MKGKTAWRFSEWTQFLKEALTVLKSFTINFFTELFCF